jgi:hypothetical protein
LHNCKKSLLPEKNNEAQNEEFNAMIQKAYELTRDHSRFVEDEVEIDDGDGYLESQFPDWDIMDAAFFYAFPIELGGSKGEIFRESKCRNIIGARIPEKVVFTGLKDWLEPTDYPYIPKVSTWPIISRRMLDVLLSVGDFPHQAIPVVFKSVDYPEYSDAKRRAKALIRNHDYIILQLLEHSDVFDMEKSEYNTDRGVADPERIFLIDVENVVLKEPPGGFPPIFRIKDYEYSLYVSAEAKQALEDAGIQGLDFDTYQLETP